jgi:hypothetical protein
LSRQLKGEDWILLFYRSISRQFQRLGEKSYTATQSGTVGQDYDWVILSDGHANCRRSSAIRQQFRCCRSCIIIQVSEYLLNNRWVFNAGNYLDETGTFAAFISLLEGLQLAVQQSGSENHRQYRRPCGNQKDFHPPGGTSSPC